MVAFPWPARALGRVLLVGGSLLLAHACTPAQGDTQPPATVSPARAEVQLQALYSGCREIRRNMHGLVCMLEPGAELTLWVGVDPEIGAELTIDGASVASSPHVASGGLRWQLQPRAEARRIEVRAELDGASGRFVMQLVMQPRPRLAELDRIAALSRLRVARRRLAVLLPELEGEPLVLGLRLAGDLASYEGDNEGWIEAHAQGVDAALAVGWRRDASEMAQNTAYACSLRYDEACVSRWLERDAALVADDPEQRMHHSYHRGLQAERAGDLRVALREYRESERQAHALGFDVLTVATITQQLLLAERLGAHERAATLRTRVEALEGTLARPLHRSQLVNAIAWMLLEARGRGLLSEDPVPLLQRALALVGKRAGVLEASQRQTILLNLAYAAVLERDARTARRWLARIEGEDLTPLDRSWRQLLLARVAWLEGDLEAAQRRFSALLDAADRLHEPELRWHVLVGQGEILEALGRPALARDSYEAAEALLEAQLPHIALRSGRERFMAERHRSAGKLVDLLLRQEDRGSALCAARLARTRALRMLTWQLGSAARDPRVRDELQRLSQEQARIAAAHDASWSLPARAAAVEQRRLERDRETNDEALDRVLAQLDPGPSTRACEQLPKVAPGELHLHYMQLDDGWVGFAVDREGIVSERLGPLSLADASTREAWPRLGGALLEPFVSRIHRARRIRIMTTGELTGVPFHALPVEGDHTPMLLDLAEVRYGLDLPVVTAGAAPRQARTGGAMLVVPPSNLRHVQDEVSEVRAALEERGFEVAVMTGDEARGKSVREALPQVDLLHYAGHAHSEGLSGWDSALSLARGDTLGVDDVLPLRPAPATVVLGGCETGLADPHSLAGGMSLAHAFVLAGSRSVIATPSEVDDTSMTALMQELYRAMATDEAADVDEALRVAQCSEPREDWLQVRIFEP